MSVRLIGSRGEWVDLPITNYLLMPIHGTEYNGLRFTYYANGQTIPLNQQPLVAGNIARVIVPPHLLVTFYSDVGCIHVLETVAGTNLSLLGEPSTFVGDAMITYPNRVRGIGITNPRGLFPVTGNAVVTTNNPDTPTSDEKGIVPMWVWIFIGIMGIVVVTLLCLMLFQSWSALHPNPSHQSPHYPVPSPPSSQQPHYPIHPPQPSSQQPHYPIPALPSPLPPQPLVFSTSF